MHFSFLTLTIVKFAVSAVFFCKLALALHLAAVVLWPRCLTPEQHVSRATPRKHAKPLGNNILAGIIFEQEERQ